mgnify:FL=1|jgi:hypothetical protein
MDRAQAHTLEAITASLILISSLVFALQVTAVTPLTGSTSSQHIENQQAAVAEGILASAAENGTLKPTLLHWNESEQNWHNATNDGYVQGPPPTAFGDTLQEMFLDRGVVFDLTVYYIDDSGDRQRESIVDLGEPSDHASTASRTVTLADDDPLRESDGSASNTTLSNASYLVADADPNQALYSVVEVELVVWRM